MDSTGKDIHSDQSDMHEVHLNDKTIRLIGIPFFGIVIPNLTGIFGTLTYRDSKYWVGYIFFIALATMIWEGNRYLMFRTRKRFTWFDKPIEKLILLFMNNIFYTTPLTIAWICLWYISTDPPKATLFTENLADIYRYILAQKERTLVVLEDEFSFMDKYAELLRLRFGQALAIQNNFNGTTSKEYLVPPISAFVALENAVKHNEISERIPLQVLLSIENDQLTISNKIQPKRSIQHSSKIGLKNLNERFKIITGKGIYTDINNSTFNVTLPLIPLTR